MAVVSLLLGGCVGFFSALFGLVILNVSWIAAFGLWSGIGTIASVAVLALVMLPRRHAQPDMIAERA
jgi:hypothetical protein